MTDIDETMRAFWQWFSDHLADFRTLSDPEEPFWDIALEQIKTVDQRLWIELSGAGESIREFVVTAQGKSEAFPIVERLVDLAPRIEGWVFVALKPAMGFDFTTRYEGRLFAPQGMWFLPLDSPSRPKELGLRIGIPGLQAQDEDTARNAIFVILDAALGERSAALDVHHIEVCQLPTNPESLGYIELPELAQYIAWRKKKLAQLDG